MSSVKFTTILDGVPRLVRQLQLADAGVRERTKAAIERGTKRVAAGARQRAPKVTEEMVSTIRDEYSKDGLVGFVKVGFGKLPRRSHASTVARRERLAQKRKTRGTRTGKGAYAPVVERGDPRRHKKPHPFLIPELVQDRPEIMADLKRATIDGAKAAEL